MAANQPTSYSPPSLPNLYAGYGGGSDRPLGSYALLAGVWGSLLAGFLALSRALGRPLPKLAAWDIAMLAGATFQGARLVSKDSITSFVRAPFTRYKEPGAPGESNEEPRKETPAQHAIGELLVCPFCLATWVASFLVYGLGLAPAFTRMLSGLLCAIGLADFIQLGYSAATKKAEG